MPKSTAAPTPPKPGQIVTCPMEVGGFVSTVRRSIHVSQADLAARAKVSRQWIVALEQGKPSLELGMVLRTLEAMGFEIELKPYDPMPPWILRAIEDAKRLHAAQQLARNTRRRELRAEIAREARRTRNARSVMLDLGCGLFLDRLYSLYLSNQEIFARGIHPSKELKSHLNTSTESSRVSGA